MPLGASLVSLCVFCLPGAPAPQASAPAANAPASVQTAVSPPASTTPEEVVGRVLSADPAGGELAVALGGVSTRVEVDPPAAEIFLPGSVVRGFLRPPAAAGLLPRLENIWPAQPPLFEALDRGIKALEAELADQDLDDDCATDVTGLAAATATDSYDGDDWDNF